MSLVAWAPGQAGGDFYVNVKNDSVYSIIPSTCVSTIACFPALLCSNSRSKPSMKNFSVSTAGHKM